MVTADTLSLLVAARLDPSNDQRFFDLADSLDEVGKPYFAKTVRLLAKHSNRMVDDSQISNWMGGVQDQYRGTIAGISVIIWHEYMPAVEHRQSCLLIDIGTMCHHCTPEHGLGLESELDR